MEKVRLAALSIAAAIVFTTSVTGGLLPAGALSGWDSKTESFELKNSAQTKTLKGTIEYAVYDTDDYNTIAGTSFDSGLGAYLYAYIVSNDVGSNLAFEKFSMAIDDGMTVGQIDRDSFGLTGGVNPTYQYWNASSNPDSGIFLYMPLSFFGSEGMIDPGENSAILLFTSDDSPGPGYGSIEGGSLAGVVENIVAPAPEPATIAMLGLGGLALVRNKRK